MCFFHWWSSHLHRLSVHSKRFPWCCRRTFFPPRWAVIWCSLQQTSLSAADWRSRRDEADDRNQNILWPNFVAYCVTPKCCQCCYFFFLSSRTEIATQSPAETFRKERISTLLEVRERLHPKWWREVGGGGGFFLLSAKLFESCLTAWCEQHRRDLTHFRTVLKDLHVQHHQMKQQLCHVCFLLTVFFFSCSPNIDIK